MAARTTPPFRADHVGSLLRPPELLRARDQLAAGAITAEELRDAEDRAIESVVVMQREVGLRSATDGELRRASWHMDFIYQLGGVSQARDRLKVQAPVVGDRRDPQAHDPVAEHGPLPRRPAAIDPGVYDDIDEFWSDLSAVYAEQVRRLSELGCTYLQFDALTIAAWPPTTLRAAGSSGGG
jgi:5-methyltetrahydropteroyltriglutamate--homocysteine methyltransferase